MKWEYYCQCSLQLKFKQNMYVFSLIQIKLEQVWQSTNECAAHQKSSRSSVFTPVSPISKTEILSCKILPDGGILPNTGIWIRYIPLMFTTPTSHCSVPGGDWTQLDSSSTTTKHALTLFSHYFCTVSLGGTPNHVNKNMFL